MIFCTLCEKPGRKTSVAGVFLTRSGCRSPWQLCLACSEKFKCASETERGELLTLIEMTLADGGE